MFIQQEVFGGTFFLSAPNGFNIQTIHPQSPRLTTPSLVTRTVRRKIIFFSPAQGAVKTKTKTKD